MSSGREKVFSPGKKENPKRSNSFVKTTKNPYPGIRKTLRNVFNSPIDFPATNRYNNTDTLCTPAGAYGYGIIVFRRKSH